jgi:hypothetical protein
LQEQLTSISARAIETETLLKAELTSKATELAITTAELLKA